MIRRDEIQTAFRSIQNAICTSLEELDGGEFRIDPWTMPSGGGGESRVIEGAHIEKGGVNFSAVKGPVSDALKKMLGKDGKEFFATGVSIVLHPCNPHVPIIHMNVRYFEMGTSWWFGGGIDLTPHYVVPTDARFFHKQLKAVCDRSDPAYYSRFKDWADDYFYVRHREETRGVGGIFFDRLTAGLDKSQKQIFDFVLDVGNAFIPIYKQLFLENSDSPYTQKEKQWQLVRRGRYAEFNLVWDRGTKFGLETGGRTESILMSLPPLAKWEYAQEPEEGSPELATLNYLKKGVDWVNI